MLHDGGRVVLLALALVLVGSLAVPGRTHAQAPAPRTITVVSEGEARAEPDVAFLTAGVTTDAATPREALSTANARVAAVSAALRAAGIAQADIQTAGLTLFPESGPPERPGAAPVTTGYRAVNTVSVTLRDITRVEATIEALLAAGITNLQGVRFGVADQTALHQRALADAVQQARPLGEAAAGAAGLTLGPIVAISEAISGGPGPVVSAAERGGGGDFVAGGTLTLTVRVQVTFQIAG